MPIAIAIATAIAIAIAIIKFKIRLNLCWSVEYLEGDKSKTIEMSKM